MLTAIDVATLVAAFPAEKREIAVLAGADTTLRLAQRQWTEQFPVQVGGETLLIPARLYFASGKSTSLEGSREWLFVQALQTRSNDGFERQRACRNLLKAMEPSTAPFVVALVGEYVVEILNDIAAAMSPEIEQTIGAFIVRNEAFWDATKQRVASYWNVYYRARWLNDLGRAERRDEYVGFQLIELFEAAASRGVSAISK